MPYIHIYILCEKKTCIHNIYIYTHTSTISHIPTSTASPKVRIMPCSRTDFTVASRNPGLTSPGKSGKSPSFGEKFGEILLEIFCKLVLGNILSLFGKSPSFGNEFYWKYYWEFLCSSIGMFPWSDELLLIKIRYSINNTVKNHVVSPKKIETVKFVTIVGLDVT